MGASLAFWLLAGCGAASPYPVEGCPAINQESTPNQASGSFVIDEQTLRPCAASQSIVEGATQATPPEIMRAQLDLGVCLANLHADAAALTVFGDIVHEGASHPYFHAVLAHLANLHGRLGVAADIQVFMIHFTVEDLVSFERSGRSATSGHARYLLGRNRYVSGSFHEAIAVFHEVRPDQPDYVHARALEAVSHLRLRRDDASRAVWIELTQVASEQSVRDLAWLNVGRLDYTAGRYADAIAAWARVTPCGRHGGAAQFGRAWGYFRANDLAAAEHALDTLPSAALQTTERAEAALLRVMIEFTRCRYAQALTLLDAFVRNFRLQLGLLQQYVHSLDENDAFETYRHGLDGSLSQPVREVFADPSVQRQLAYARHLDLFDVRATDSLGSRVLQDHLMQESLAVGTANDLVRARASRIADDLQDLLSQARTIRIESLHALTRPSADSEE